MITDAEIRVRGFRALAGELGNVHAERFITLTMREPFDYTEWQRGLFGHATVEELSRVAMKSRSRGKGHRRHAAVASGV